MALADPRGIWVKVDGVTRPEDAEAANDAGVSAVGMIFAPSPRQLTVEQAERVRRAIDPSLEAFGVFDATSPSQIVDVAARLDLQGVQFPAEVDLAVMGPVVLRTVRVRGAEDLQRLEELDCDAVHLDAYVEGALGGTGHVAPWDVIEAHRPAVPFVISGGLRPENVGDAVRRLRPRGVDVSSGVESEPGIKDAARMRDFVSAAREAAARGGAG